MRIDELDYELPKELIATEPVRPRDSARLLVVSRSDPSRLEHRIVRDLPELLGAGDRLVFNTTSVVAARFRGRNMDTGGRAEGLFLHDAGRDAEGNPVWVVMLRARRFRPGRRVELFTPELEHSGVVLTLIEHDDGEAGAWRVSVEAPHGCEPTTGTLLDRAGLTPLPPYILHARRDRGEPIDRGCDGADYQAVFADPQQPGSIAAPTAGLHFTPELLGRLGRAGVERAEVVLHVGTGTFKPIECERVEDHPMHSERCSLGGAGAGVFDAPGRLIAVGTTSARTLEAFAQLREAGGALPEQLDTDLLVTPGYRWQEVDGLLTNFHLPRSTLLAMVGALFDGGVGRLLEIYDEAVREGYRFYSFGDAMLVLP